MHGITKFGLLMLTVLSIAMAILRLMYQFYVGIGTGFFNYLFAVGVLFSVFWAIAWVMIFAGLIRQFIFLGIVFIVALVIGIWFVSPLYVVYPHAASGVTIFGLP